MCMHHTKKRIENKRDKYKAGVTTKGQAVSEQQVIDIQCGQISG